MYKTEIVLGFPKSGNRWETSKIEAVPDTGSNMLLVNSTKCEGCDLEDGNWDPKYGEKVSFLAREIRYAGGQKSTYNLWKAYLMNYGQNREKEISFGVVSNLSSHFNPENVMGLQPNSGFLSQLCGPKMILFDFPKNKLVIGNIDSYQNNQSRNNQNRNNFQNNQNQNNQNQNNQYQNQNKNNQNQNNQYNQNNQNNQNQNNQNNQNQNNQKKEISFDINISPINSVNYIQSKLKNIYSTKISPNGTKTKELIPISNLNKYKVIIDTGTFNTVIPHDLFSKIGQKSDYVTLDFINQNNQNSSEITFPMEFVREGSIIDNKTILIGNSWLTPYSIAFDFENNKIRFIE